MKKYLLFFPVFLIIFYGCVTPRTAKVSDTMALDNPPQIEVPEQRVEPPAPEVFPPVKNEQLFSLSFRNADVRDVFLMLSEESGVNIISDSGIQGKISIDFTGLSLQSALYAITKQLGYTFRADRGFVMVSSKPVLETRSFTIDYITGKRSSTSTMSAAISAGGTSGGMTGSSSNITLNLADAGKTSSGAGAVSASGQGNVNVTTSDISDFWNEIIMGLEIIIFGDSGGSSSGKGGYSRGDSSGKKLAVSKLAGIVNITDYSDNMERIEDFLKDVEMSVKRQVMIQAHIIEVSLNDDFKLGIDWDLIAGSGTGELGELFQFSQGLVVSPLTDVFQINVSNKKVNFLLDAMKEQGQVNVLSSPKVTTMNNQKAVIKLTTKEVSWITNSFLNAEGNVLLTYTTPQVDEVGLFLDVSPQIDENGIITMQVHPNISEKIRDSISPDGKSSKPVIDVREVDTMVKVKNGQTIVIAGLITDKIHDSLRKVPLFGDVPVLGSLFRQSVQKKEKTELVILLTPYVLNDRSIEDIRIAHEERLRKAGRAFSPVPELKTGEKAFYTQ